MSATSVELIVFLVVFSTANELNYRFNPTKPRTAMRELPHC